MHSIAQNVQPSMMILPYTKSGESALNLYEEVSEYRALILGVEKAFLDRGAELIDLERTILNAREQMRREASKYKDINDRLDEIVAYCIPEQEVTEERKNMLLDLKVEVSKDSYENIGMLVRNKIKELLAYA